MTSDYEKAKAKGLTAKNRWEEGQDHHPMSERLERFLADHDFGDYGDYFRWKFGGDGDNGETLVYEMDAFFELLDSELSAKLDQANRERDEALALLSFMSVLANMRDITPLRGMYTAKHADCALRRSIAGMTPLAHGTASPWQPALRRPASDTRNWNLAHGNGSLPEHHCAVCSTPGTTTKHLEILTSSQK